MKLTLISSILILSTTIFIGCTPRFTNSNKHLISSQAFEHKKTTIKLPYDKALANLTLGLENCVQDLYISSKRNIDKVPFVEKYGYYHVLNKHKSKSEYNLRLRMRDMREGDCSVCMGKGGFFSIYATLEKVKGKTIFTSHANEYKKRYVKGLEKWTKGKLNSCYAFSMLDAN